MKKFIDLYEAVSKAKVKPAKVKYIGPYTNGGESDYPAVILEMAGVRFLAMAMGGKGSYKNPDNSKIERPVSIGIKHDGDWIAIENMLNEFTAAKLWNYRDGTSTNRNKHTYPVLDKDVKSMKETATAWNALKKVILPAVQNLFTTDETAIRKWNNAHVPGEQIAMPGEPKPTAASVEAPAKANKPVKPKPASKGTLGDWLSKVAKSAKAEYHVTGDNDFAKMHFASSDIISKNKLKAEIEHLGGKTTKASNSSVSVYDLDDKQITFGYDYMMVKRK